MEPEAGPRLRDREGVLEKNSFGSGCRPIVIGMPNFVRDMLFLIPVAIACCFLEA